MWMSVVIAVNIFVYPIVAIPVQNDIAKSFQVAVNQQNLNTILTAIEERLRNLDNLYSMHLSPTLEDKLEQYHRRLESIDTKIIRLESLVMLNLDKISENISTKNYKDDIARTNLMKKIDSIYEGLSHRLNYLDRKFETNSVKVQNKLEITLTKLEKMEEEMTSRNDDIEVEISDAIAAIDDLKTTCIQMEENIVNNTNDNFEVSLKEQLEIVKKYTDQSNKILKEFFDNSTKNLHQIDENITKGLYIMNETEFILKDMNHELKQDLNEYAVKVAEMNAENWKSETTLRDKQQVMENVINSTKTEVQNSLRTLMILVGKIGKQDIIPEEKAQMDRLNDKIDANFEKVFSAQNLFLDSCYRLQMDESQIESKISIILEKLIETFEKKTAIEIKDIKNLEKQIKNHDVRITRNLHLANRNIVTIYDKITKDHNQFEGNLKRITDHLSTIISLIQDIMKDTFTDEHGSKIHVALKGLSQAEINISALVEQGNEILNSAKQIKEVVELLVKQNHSDPGDTYCKSVAQKIDTMEAKFNFNTSKMDNIFNNVTKHLQELKELMTKEQLQSPEDTQNISNTENVDKLIEEIFGIKNSQKPSENTSDSNRFKITNTNPNEQIGNETSTKQYYLNLINVRMNPNTEMITTEYSTEEDNKISEEYGTTEFYDEFNPTEESVDFNIFGST